ncbi:DNA polymerase Y family protein [Amycolatopsis cynarae]|uniref:DNA polymerase Y family protein n=1 Tax=Amycolatopsis cynarae TaxID=2995223 RepID=A0ABY7BBW8_9PSEU|nr:DNA polymerase Y family protein [Amycolatopsis sp. HUAS 11-8]WAL69885.1 DNA polymerase Y family protein [Amycolatopsis sp. HUAS 11-8]
MLVLWCPDWPAVAAATAAGVPAHRPAAVFSANRVVACSAVARSAGVRRGMRRRDAQSRCPELAVLGHDEARDARLFEPVAAAVEELVVGVEVVRPGVVAVPVDGAAGYFGGELRLAELLTDQVATRAGVECQIGVADGLFAATLAAHRSMLVERGTTREFLAPLSIAELDQPEAGRGELVDLLRRLGLRTLGAFAGLAGRDVVSRFGSAGLLAHRLASGRSERPPHRRRPPPELAVVKEFDPPLERVDAAAFVAKTLADRFHAGLAGHGLACTRLGIYATTERGEELSRVWRCAEPLTPHGIADRVRWQFEGWLRGGGLSSGVSLLRLAPEETVAGQSLQLGLWRGNADARDLGDGHELAEEKAGRALVRVQGLLGPESVFTAVLDGGRGPAERVRLVPWGDRRARESAPEEPWPGRLPAPSPATVFEQAVPARVLDAAGEPVRLTRRRELAAPPVAVGLPGETPRPVLDWAGPWRAGARPGAAGPSREQVRIQAVLAGEPELAVLLTGTGQENPQWTVEGVYD